MVKAADMVIGMETWHMQTLKKQFPEYKDKFFLLPLFEHNREVTKNEFYRYNIEDPYGRAIDEFQKCFTRIERCVEGLFKEIENS